MKWIKAFFAAAFVISMATTLPAAQVMVFAAASLTDSLKQAAAEYEKTSADKIIFNFAASGILARQIEAGAPADIFFSADERQMDAVEAKGLLAAKSRRNLLGNTLVIVTPSESPAIDSAWALTNSSVRRIAVGDWKTVPAGTYAKEYLERVGCWAAIEPKIVPCENVRAVLAVVESGNADAGIVYKTDAAISQRVAVAHEVPAGQGPKIVYPIALVKGSAEREAARRFFSYLTSADAANSFKKYGFNPLEKPEFSR